MTTNSATDFETLAEAALNDNATDAQLEALELAIMERGDGADVLRDLAESQVTALAPEVVAQLPSSRGAGKPVLLKLVLFGTLSAAAAVLMLFGAGMLFMHSNRGPSHPSQVAKSPPVQMPGEELPNDFSIDDAEMTPIATAVVPEPSTSLLLLSGLTLVLFRRRRQREH